jgi:hypothetical protein
MDDVLGDQETLFHYLFPLSFVLDSTKQPGLNIVESMYFVPKRRRRRSRRSFS